MKTGPKLALIIAAVVVLLYAVKEGINHGILPGAKVLKSLGVSKATLPDVKDAVVENVTALAYPTSDSNGCEGPIRSEIWAWNSQIGALYANGGTDTTKGSLVEKHGGCVHYQRQDDTSIMKTDLTACAKELKDSTECSDGVHFVTIMGDGAGQFFAELNPQLKKICNDCTAEIIGTTGFSRGEDKLMGPEAWKKNPRSALGDGLIVGVLRDGDWDIAMKWAADNNLKNNPDEHTFDPKALNWVNAPSYTDAAAKYVQGYCEDRKLVDENGKLTGDTKNYCIKGVVTWTPGDVTAAKNKGGLVSIVSTKEYRSQMPSAIIGIKKWNKAHGEKIAAMLAAGLEGGDQVKAFPDALKLAGDISAKVYGEGTGAYWVKYYKGGQEPDTNGKLVDLGGSYASNMNDALNVFGLAPGSNNNFKATYTIFGKIVDQQYHDLYKSTPIPPYGEVSNTSYLLQAKSLLDDAGSEADKPQFSSNSDTSHVVGDKNWDIEFAVGSDKLTNQGMSVVREIKDQTAITGLTIILNGHTDNTGNADLNRRLSEARAESVKNALEMLAPTDFPEARFRVHGFGPDKPIASNSTDAGRAKNRRVQVVMAE